MSMVYAYIYIYMEGICIYARLTLDSIAEAKQRETRLSSQPCSTDVHRLCPKDFPCKRDQLTSSNAIQLQLCVLVLDQTSAAFLYIYMTNLIKI